MQSASSMLTLVYRRHTLCKVPNESGWRKPVQLAIANCGLDFISSGAANFLNFGNEYTAIFEGALPE